MYNLIERYIDNLSIYDLNLLAIKKNINLSDEELDFSYNFIKKNWKNILANPKLFDINKYKDYYTEDNFIKIKQLVKEYMHKYGNLM